jgi:DNA-3-methyladenine glycosylase I
MLILEGAQAGLSWITVLRKRDNYRKAFLGFDPKKVARIDARGRATLLKNDGIVRNRAKIAATVSNAKAFLEVQAAHGSFDRYLWAFVNSEPVTNEFRRMGDVPAKNAVAIALSKDLKRRGFKFVGPTIMYAFMQAVGMVNDHLVSCFRRAEVGKAATRSKRGRVRGVTRSSRVSP